MIRSVLTLRVAEQRGADFEQFYARHGILERARAFGGCRGAQLWRSLGEDGRTYVVTADWDSPEDYQRWVDEPWRAALLPELVALLDTDPDKPVVGELYELVPPE